jgi:hypothetical protein
MELFRHSRDNVSLRYIATMLCLEVYIISLKVFPYTGVWLQPVPLKVENEVTSGSHFL